MDVQEMNISFAGCGFLGIYHVGVASCIKEYAPSLYQKKISGSSAGAICACALLCGCSLGAGTTQVLKVAVKARSRALGPLHPDFKIVKILKEGLEDMLPEDAHLICTNKLFISLTRLSDGKNELVSEYYSKQDLIQALLCSSFIPFYSGFIPPLFHGERYFDGSFSNNLPQIDSNTITVSPFSGECDICPLDENINILQVYLANTSVNLSSGNFYRFCQILFPPHPDTLNELCKQGFDDALRFLNRNNLISCVRCLALTSSIEVKSNCSCNEKPPDDYDGGKNNKSEFFDNKNFEGKNGDDEEESCHMEHGGEGADYASCKECKNIRKVALLDSIPDNVAQAIQSAADSLDSGFVNWIFSHRLVKVISLISSTYLLPVEIVIINFLKVWNNLPEVVTDCIQGISFVQHLVKSFISYFNHERHRYSAKFSYELAITEIDRAEIAQLASYEHNKYEVMCSNHLARLHDNSHDLTDMIWNEENVCMAMSEKVTDTVSVNFNVEIPTDTVDGISSKCKKMNIVEAIKASYSPDVSRPQAAINISNKALAMEHQRLMKSTNFNQNETLDEAMSAPEQSEAIFSYCYLDDDGKTVKITQIYNVLNDIESIAPSSSEVFTSSENLSRWDLLERSQCDDEESIELIDESPLPTTPIFSSNSTSSAEMINYTNCAESMCLSPTQP